MADLDVTEILFDPDFADYLALVCERATETVDAHGRVSLSTVNTTFTAVVTSNSGDILERMTDAERVKGSITVHTTFTLYPGTATTAADVVQWRGRRYTVSNVNDYSHFGAGFIAATCDVIPVTG